MHFAVDQQKALAHVFRDCGKLALAQMQLVHLLADGAVLLAQLVKQRRQLRIIFLNQQIDGGGLMALRGFVICRASR